MRNTIRFDWAIKRLLRNKANFGILEGFLSELLSENIVIKSLLESEGNQQNAVNKLNRVDLLVENAKGELLIIEVQSDYTSDYLLRILFGTAKLIVDNMDKGYRYSEIKKVISVNILYFDLGHGEDYIYHGTTRFIGMYKHDVLSLSAREKIVFNAEQIAQLYPEYYIIKVNEFDGVAKNTLDEWVQFLKNEVVNNDTKAKGLLEAKEKMDILKLSKEEMIAYESDLDAWRDYASSMSTHFLEGIAKGEANKETYAQEVAEQTRKAKEMEVAKNCLLQGMDVQTTAKISSLTEAEIRLLM
jgi:predicted transposase/invertase (TIGR01784 family)